MMQLDGLTYLPDDLLRRVDRAAMGTSLETRIPFLDHRVVELAWRLPLEMKIKSEVGKRPMKILETIFHVNYLIGRKWVLLFRWGTGCVLRDWAEDLPKKKTR